MLKLLTHALSIFVGVAIFCIFCVSSCCAQEVQTEELLRPFSPEINYMSLPGYLRHGKFLSSGRWEPVINAYVGSDPFFTDRQTLVTESTVTINLGDLAMDIGELMADYVLAEGVRNSINLLIFNGFQTLLRLKGSEQLVL